MAQSWAGQRSGPDEREEDLRAFGVTDPDIRQWIGTVAETDVLPVLSWCLPAVEVFFALSTQWRRAGMAGIATGLEYQAIPSTLWMMGIRLPPSQRALLMRDLRIMEQAALDVFRGGHE